MPDQEVAEACETAGISVEAFEYVLAALVPDGSEAVIVLRGGEVVTVQDVFKLHRSRVRVLDTGIKYPHVFNALARQLAEEGSMSAYEDAPIFDDAIQAAMWIEFTAPVGISEATFRAMVNAYLAALPDSMLVDGQMVGLAEVYARFDNQSECVGIAIADARRAIAARQVAEEEA